MKMTKADPYKDSPYDASGMPLGAEAVDYDKVEDVAKATVKDKPVEHPKSINDIEYELPQIKLDKELDKKDFNRAIEDDVNPATVPVDAVDFDDPDEKRKLIAKDAFAKDQAVPELPKVEKDEDFLNEIKEDEGKK